MADGKSGSREMGGGEAFAVSPRGGRGRQKRSAANITESLGPRTSRKASNSPLRRSFSGPARSRRALPIPHPS